MGAGPRDGRQENLDPKDLIFQTIDVPAVADTTLYAWFPQEALSDRPIMTIRSENVAHPVIRFDLAALPSPERMAVARAVLRVYVQSRTNPLSLHAEAYALNRPWVEDQATWYRADEHTPWDGAGAGGVPGDRAGDPSASAELSGEGEWVEFDVTELVRAWVQGERANYGVILAGSARGSVGYALVSTKYSDPTQWPHLSILYSNLPTSTPTPTPVPTATPTPVPMRPQLQVQKVGPAGPLPVNGQTITYNITVCNVGNQPAANVSLVDTLPLGTVFLSASEGGTYDAAQHVITWTGLSLDSGECKTIVLHVDLAEWVAEKGQIVNVVKARCDQGTVVEDYWETIIIPASPSPPWRLYLVEVRDQA